MRIDALTLRQSVDLLALIGSQTVLRKVAATNGGEYAGPCPFCGGRDRLRVQPERGRWWCRQCGADRWDDAIGFVQRLAGVSFPEACAMLSAGHPAGSGGRRRGATSSPRGVTPEPTSAWRAAAREVAELCERLLWSDAGGRAREWLRRRGLDEPTLRRWHVGYQPRDAAVRGLYIRRGIVLPWICGDRVWQLKVRRPDPLRPKYVGVAGGRPHLFGADTLAGHNTAVVVEGEFDVMLLEQEAGDLVGVVTLGSCSKRLGLDAVGHLLSVRRVLVVLDRDAEGQRGAEVLATTSARIRRSTVPRGKDVTEFWALGGRLADWVAYELARIEQGR